jgi:hypothetical protein
MLIRHLAILSLALAACASQLPPPDASIEVTAKVACNPPNYPCDPNNHASNTVCEWICGNGAAGDGYCAPHTAVEDMYCELHPDHFFRGDPNKYCDAWGNASWYTHCVPSWAP